MVLVLLDAFTIWMDLLVFAICSLEESTGLAIRFMIGKTKSEEKMAQLRREIAEYDDFVLLDIEEEYSKLPYKTLVRVIWFRSYLTTQYELQGSNPW